MSSCLLPRCACDLATEWLARMAKIYMLASMGYLMLTRTYGTPFFDSLSDEQRIIHASSAKQRKEAFVQAILVSTLLVAFLESSQNKARV